MPASPCYVITGAAGFLGSALAHRLNQFGRDNLILVDALESDNRWRNLVPLRYADYFDRKDFMESLLAGKFDGLGIKAIFHLGACSSTTETDVGFLFKNNFEYTKLLAQWCGGRKVPTRFIYASSAATYGDGGLGYSDDHALLPNLRPLNAYGYSKHMFDLWARILTSVPGSVLWLLGDDTVRRNLSREWSARGMDSARLVFAPRKPSPAHLARHVHADLFLDTFRYNAHTTAADALWMGLPVLTCPGETFASRVAGSMLKAIALPELIARNEDDYLALAIELATNPALLAGYRTRLAENRLTTPLFDITQFTRAMEATFEGLWHRWRSA